MRYCVYSKMTTNMESDKSLDNLIQIIAAYLVDVERLHRGVFSTQAAALTIRKIRNRCSTEGISFLTKALPRLGKAFDKALVREQWNSADFVGFKPHKNGQFPKFLGELFSLVFSPDGKVLKDPSCSAIRNIREILAFYGKYKLPYKTDEEAKVVEAFEKADADLVSVNAQLDEFSRAVDSADSTSPINGSQWSWLRDARRLLHRALAACSITDIKPRHGPGAVSTRERHWRKYQWTNVSERITDVYPYDTHFCASFGHVCDQYEDFSRIDTKELPARVILVPKDSRGPRLISCEPLSNQWIQQGVADALVRYVESCEYTKYSVFFTDQTYNRIAAIHGSTSGRYATLDLKEASDRVSLSLVKFLFPEHILRGILCCRTLSTMLPSGKLVHFQKYAPMGSALCFPVLALTVWALVAAKLHGCRTYMSKKDREDNFQYFDDIHVYGDDIIVPTEKSADAIEALESVGLLVNRQKSCMTGFFRESCGMDAYKGVNVTPTRFKTPLSSSPSPDSYTSWIAYANSFYDRGYYHTYDQIVRLLFQVYPEVPASADFPNGEVPALRDVPEDHLPKRRRTNKHLQRREQYVYVVKAKRCSKETDGWSMLLRYFVEPGPPPDPIEPDSWSRSSHGLIYSPFSVSEYTERKASMLVKRWR